MKIIRLENINRRYEILSDEISKISQEMVAQTKDNQESDSKVVSELLNELKNHSRRVTEIAEDSTRISQDLNYSKQYCELYDQYFFAYKKLTLLINKYFQIISGLSTEKSKLKLELSKTKLAMYDHQNELLIHTLNDYSKNQIPNNKQNKNTIHNLIDNFGQLSFYHSLLEIER